MAIARHRPRPRAHAAHPPTPEQQLIYDAAPAADSIVIEAVAGAGKTTTLRGIAELHVERGRSGLYLAYNRKIREEAEKVFPQGVDCKTGHALASTPEYQERRATSGYMPPWRVAQLLGIRESVRWREDAVPLQPRRLAYYALQAVDRFCQSADARPGIQHVPSVFDMADPRNVALGRMLVGWAAKAWDQHISPMNGAMKFTHDHYLKLFQLAMMDDPSKVPGYEFVEFDECQDANPVVLDIVQRVAAKGAQVIAVGDRAQAIYRFRGAVDAMDAFDGKRFSLTTSFRFGPAIAEEANRWLSVLDVSDTRVTGFDRVPSRIVAEIEDPDAILCRSNAGVIGEVMRLRGTTNKRIAIGGGTDEIKRMAYAALKLQEGKPTDHPELAAFSSWREVNDAVQEDESLGTLKRYVGMINMFGPWKLIFMCRDMTSEKQPHDVLVGTAHSVKGCEWDRVKISHDFQAPEEGCGVDPDEAMLAYVTLTRPRLELSRGSLDWIDSYA